MRNLEEFSLTNNLRRLHPCLKMGYSISALIFCLTAENWIEPLVAILPLWISLLALQKKERWRLLIIPLAPLLFVIPGSLPFWFEYKAGSVSGAIMNIPFGEHVFALTNQTMVYALSFMFRAMSCIMALFFLILSTPLSDIDYGLKSLRVPSLLRELFVLTYRYIFILLELAGVIICSQKGRGGYLSKGNGFRSFSLMISSVLVRSIHFSQKNYQALQARGYNGSLEFLSPFTYQGGYQWGALGGYLLVNVIVRYAI